MDKFSKKKRSEIMSKIRGKETKPEITVRKFLFAKGFRFRKNVKSLSGKPDIILPKYNTAVFIHGCFWHGHKSCSRSKLPETRRFFWKNKIISNQKRDAEVKNKLLSQGWNIFVVWQCELNSNTKEKRLKKLVKEIKSQK